MSDNDGNKEQRVGLWIAGGAAALSVLVILFYAVYGWETGKIEGSPAYGQTEVEADISGSGVEVIGAEAASLAAAPAASNPAEIVILEAGQQAAAEMTGANAVVENGIVKFYFATGKADLAANTEEALQEVLAGTKEGRKAVISGYNDSTGNAAANEALSKQRAFAVRNALLGFGVPENQIELRKPENTEAGLGNNAEARRVEVFLE